VVVETEAARIGSGVLPQIRVLDGRQRLLASDDSQALRGDCRVSFVAPEDGDYVVEFSDSRYRGGNPPQYRLKIGDYDFVEEVFPLGARRGDKLTFTLRGGTRPAETAVPFVLSPAGRDWPERDRLLPLPPLFKPGMASPRVAVS